MKPLSRRTFLQSSIVAATALPFAPLLTGCSSTRATARKGRVIGPNEEIRFAVIGFNGQGGSHISSILGLQEKGEKVRLTALCDADAKVLEKGVGMLRDKGHAVNGYADIRRLLEDPNVDAVSIATPNHWHALAAIWSIQAGKDVYVEKPVSHNVWEGRKIVEAARKYGRIVQTGTQCRSSRTGIAAAVEYVRAGNLGRVRIARGLCYKRRASIGKVDGPQPIPPEIDYDLWCGPAPKEPLMRKRLHYDWHWVWPTGNGDLGNQGIHQMDIARWFLGESTLSPSVVSVGGRLGYVDDGTTPNTQIVFHDYPSGALIFEVRGLPERTGAAKMTSLAEACSPTKFQGDERQLQSILEKGVGVVVHCEGGYILNPDYNAAYAFDASGKFIRAFTGSVSHHGNFVQAVRSRKYTDLHADILEGHLSSALCHTGNISYRLGRQAPPEEIRSAIRSAPDAEASFQRMLEHLKVNDVDLLATRATLGAALKMNPATERFIGNSQANAMLTRAYRPPFVVPARV